MMGDREAGEAGPRDGTRAWYYAALSGPSWATSAGLGRGGWRRGWGCFGKFAAAPRRMNPSCGAPLCSLWPARA